MRLALLGILLLPVASACSYAGELPPPPAAFVLTDLADGTTWRIGVEARQLGGTCELSNPHALAGGWFAWIEDGRLRAQEVHADAPGVDLPFEGRPSQVALFDVTFVAVEREGILLVDLATRAERYLPLPSQGFRVAKGALVAYQDGIFGPLSVYDARGDAWLVRDRPMPELGERWWPRMIEPGWLVLHSEPERGPGRYHLLDLVSGELRDLDIPSGPMALDGGYLYYLESGTLVRRPLEGGAMQEVATAASSVAEVVDGVAIEPVFSTPAHEGMRVMGVTQAAPAPAPTPEQGPTRSTVPLGTWPLLVATLALTRVLKRTPRATPPRAR